MDGTSSHAHSQSVNVSGTCCQYTMSWLIFYVLCSLVSKKLQDFLVEKKLKKIDAKVKLSIRWYGYKFSVRNCDNAGTRCIYT